MSDGQRRMICRFAFLTFCLLPTGVVSNWILNPRTTSDWSAAIDRQLGVRSSIGEVQTPTPYLTVFEQMQIGLGSHSAWVQPSRVQWTRFANSHLIEITELEMKRDDGAALFSQLIHHLRKNQSIDDPVHVTIGRLQIADPEGGASLQLLDCRILVESVGSGGRVVFEFRSETGETTPVRWELRFGQNTLFAESWSLSTGTARLPAWLIAPFVPTTRLGPRATFSGYVAGTTQGSDWTLEASNLQLDRIDLQTAFGNPFQWEVAGEVSVLARQAHFQNGHLVHLNLELRGDSGAIDSRFLESMQYWLKVDGPQFTEPQLVPFQQLLLGLEIRDHQLFVWGPDPKYEIAYDTRQRPIAISTRASLNLPVHVLACCVARQCENQIPADPAAINLLRFLPIDVH